jgi:hypothetical protein
VAATGDPDCQRRVNRICIARGVEKPAVYPGVWVDPRVRDAEVGDILWVLPGRHTPCYECWTAGRGAPSDARAARGARVDIQQVSLATANIVRALLNPRDERSAILDPDATAIYVHGLSPRSPGVQDVFPIDGLYSRNVRVSFPPTPCRACGGHEHPRQTQPPEPAVLSVWRGGNPYLRRRLIQIAVSLTLAALFLTTAVWAVNQLTGSTPAPAAIPAPTSKSATAPAQTTPPSSGQSADSEPPPAALESSAPVTEQPTPQAPRAVLPAGLHTTCKYTIGDGVFVGCPARFPRTEFFTVRLIVVGLDRDVWDPLEAEGYALHFVWPSGGKRVVDDCTYVTPPDNVHCDMPLIADEFPFTSGIIITDPGGDIIKNLEYPLG